ncbi:MAG: ATP-binding cassette domain-containing protein [Comamonadaceae bacterium]|nr:MAG: ATP-binding cassette domain-containing protein [Comamonadaceae bacterium]
MIELLLPERLRIGWTASADAAGPKLQERFADARGLLRSAALVSVPIGLLALIPAIFSLEVFDRVIYRHGISTLIALLAGVAVALGLEWWLRRRRAGSLREAGAAIDWALSSDLLERMLGQPLRKLEERPAAAWMALFRDVGTVRVLLTGPVVQTLFDLPVALFALVIIGVVATPVLPLVLGGLAAFCVLAWWWADEVKTGKVVELQRARNLDMLTTEICRARESVKSLGQHEPVLAQWRARYAQWLEESFRKSTQVEEAREFSHTLLLALTVGITAFGALAVVNQWMTVGGLIASNILAVRAISPIASLTSSWRQLAHSVEAARRLRAVFAEPVERSVSELSVPRPRGSIRLEKLGFAFGGPQAEPVFRDVDLTLEPGRLYAVVGRNGAGKSTLLKLLSGLYRPDSGRVLIDEYDLHQFSRAELSSWVGSLSQHVYFLDGTVAEQMRRVAPDATDDQIVRACRLSGAHEFISKMPAGYGTELVEGARSLSAGERRKIALAQVLLRNPAVLAFDEPSNDLDHDSEMQLIAALKLIAKVRTVIVVTHSAQMVANADVALAVPGNGELVQMTPQEALRTFFATVPAAARKTEAMAA